MPPHARLNWEFLAVTRGRIAPYENHDDWGRPIEKTLWLFPPGVVHGWAGVRGGQCELLVVHYSVVPNPIAELARNRGHLKTKLDRRDLKLLEGLTEILRDHYWKPTVESELFAQRALIDLCLLVMRESKERHRKQLTGGSYNRVVLAEEWLRSNLFRNPAINGAAEAVNLSSSQLYRLFMLVRKKSPQQVLNEIKIERAMELLNESNAKLQRVALESGFTSASNLCRAFKAFKGHSPTRWRLEKFIQHKTVSKSANPLDHTQHGHRVRPVL